MINKFIPSSKFNFFRRRSKWNRFFQFHNWNIHSSPESIRHFRTQIFRAFDRSSIRSKKRFFVRAWDSLRRSEDDFVAARMFCRNAMSGREDRHFVENSSTAKMNAPTFGEGDEGGIFTGALELRVQKIAKMCFHSISLRFFVYYGSSGDREAAVVRWTINLFLLFAVELDLCHSLYSIFF